jgi:hypothetical protein
MEQNPPSWQDQFYDLLRRNACPLLRSAFSGFKRSSTAGRLTPYQGGLDG